MDQNFFPLYCSVVVRCTRVCGVCPFISWWASGLCSLGRCDGAALNVCYRLDVCFHLSWEVTPELLDHRVILSVSETARLFQKPSYLPTQSLRAPASHQHLLPFPSDAGALVGGKR